MTNDSDSFIQEVDEQVRADRLVAMAKRYGPWALGAFVALLLGVVGWEFWRNHQIDEARKHSDAFAAAQEQLRAGNLQEGAAAFEALTQRGPKTYRVMAMMQRAAALEAQGDLQAAIAEFDRAAEAADDATMRDAARLRAAYLVADTQDFQAVQQRLAPLIAEHNQFSYLARELLAVEAWEAGQLQVARDTLNGITLAFDAPPSVRQRAQFELAVIGSGPAEAAAPAPANPPAPGEHK
ncbi:MAG TPA: tetratricopeptide repeat protein [Caulobacterales bacterium]|nr:tetratricopeptide repeat protein [Caulobacterales bacterium]